MSYAGLRYYQNTTDPVRAKFFGDRQGELTDLTTPLVFFTLELNRVDDARSTRCWRRMPSSGATGRSWSGSGR